VFLAACQLEESLNDFLGISDTQLSVLLNLAMDDSIVLQRDGHGPNVSSLHGAPLPKLSLCSLKNALNSIVNQFGYRFYVIIPCLEGTADFVQPSFS
jgi:hypothetical protein